MTAKEWLIAEGYHKSFSTKKVYGDIMEAYAAAEVKRVAGPLVEALAEIKALVGKDGTYSICKKDMTCFDLSETMAIGNTFERADAALAAAKKEMEEA